MFFVVPGRSVYSHRYPSQTLSRIQRGLIIVVGKITPEHSEKTVVAISAIVNQTMYDLVQEAEKLLPKEIVEAGEEIIVAEELPKVVIETKGSNRAFISRLLRLMPWIRN